LDITGGIAEVVLDNPPVNALGIADTYRLAEVFDGFRSNDDVRVAILTATGKGFCAGVDIKELQALGDHEGILGANDSCFEAFRAVYEAAVPVIAAVNDYCLGSGIGLVGNADMVIAAERATFGLPEVDNGALGAATHLSRLVPAQRARHMLYTCETATAAELLGYGTVLRVVDDAGLMPTARATAATIAAKPARTIRAAKRSMNGIDPVDVNRSYRYEQGFTFELNLAGEGDRARDAFLEGERGTD
ncbi:MAG: enoyl-CoA hydratase family protein, partial [Acidimicrobiia bacterium]|nr:enoyl-CoA hydratase family protein [Acidimicrobiia bacterium]